MSALDTKFADMPDGIRQGWLEWANSHDWGGDSEARFVTYSDGSITMEVSDWDNERPLFTTPRELRNWAGY